MAPPHRPGPHTHTQLWAALCQSRAIRIAEDKKKEEEKKVAKEEKKEEEKMKEGEGKK